MKKKVLASLMAAALALCLLPTTAFATAATSVKINGIMLDGTNYWKNGDTVACSGSAADHNAYFDATTGVLTLNGLSLTATTATAIQATGDLTIELVKANSVTSANTTTTNAFGINVDGNLTVRGSGSLISTSGTGQDHSDGVRASTNISVTGAATLTGNGGTSTYSSSGVRAGADITVSDTAALNGVGGAGPGECCGVLSSNGNIAVYGGTLAGTGGGSSSGDSMGVCNYGSGITVTGGALTGIGGAARYSYGVMSTGEAITLSGGTLTAESGTATMTSEALSKAPTLPTAYWWSTTKGTYPQGKASVAPYAYAAAQTYVKIGASGVSCGNVTVSGTQDKAITNTDVTLTLANESFNALDADADALSWFTNLPAGLSARIKTAIAADGTAATVTISGTPTELSAEVMAITIPATALANGAALTATANADAKWAIAVAPAPATIAPAPAGPDITAPAADTTVRVALGGKAELQITAPEATSFQWQVLRGNKWLNLPGAYGASYTADPAMAEDDGLQYRCIAYLSGGRSDSPIFTLEVSGVAAADPNPQTGANDAVALAAALALAALCAAGCVLMHRKK